MYHIHVDLIVFTVEQHSNLHEKSDLRYHPQFNKLSLMLDLYFSDCSMFEMLNNKNNKSIQNNGINSPRARNNMIGNNKGSTAPAVVFSNTTTTALATSIVQKIAFQGFVGMYSLQIVLFLLLIGPYDICVVVYYFPLI